MDTEALWARISQCVVRLAKARRIPVPVELQKSSGTIWERDQKRMDALVEFCQAGHINFNPNRHALKNLDLIADWFDGLALKEMEIPTVTAETPLLRKTRRTSR